MALVTESYFWFAIPNWVQDDYWHSGNILFGDVSITLVDNTNFFFILGELHRNTAITPNTKIKCNIPMTDSEKKLIQPHNVDKVDLFLTCSGGDGNIVRFRMEVIVKFDNSDIFSSSVYDHQGPAAMTTESGRTQWHFVKSQFVNYETLATADPIL